MNNKQKGNLGELLAKKYFLERGYTLLAQNYRNRRGEVDLIVSKNDVVMAIEVKLRSSYRYGFPEESIDLQKINKIKNTFLAFLFEKSVYPEKTCIGVLSIFQSDLKNKARALFNFIEIEEM